MEGESKQGAKEDEESSLVVPLREGGGGKLLQDVQVAVNAVHCVSKAIRGGAVVMSG